MGIENVVAQTATADPHRLGGVAPLNHGKRRREHKDREKLQRLHGRLMNWFLLERERQSANRTEMATDQDFYDGIQWSDEDAQELMERGQAPLVFNQIKPTVNWMLGTERRTRFDGKVLPREENDEETAEVKSKLLKYLSDVNRTPFARSEAWFSCITAGLGWLEDYISTDPTQELLGTRYENWKNIYHDSYANEKDLSDARYIFRWRWVDLDVALALCPGKEEALRATAIDGDRMALDEDDVYYMGAKLAAPGADYASVSRRTQGFLSGIVNTGRERVKLIECWYREPTAKQLIRGSKFHGEVFDKHNTEMVDLLENGECSVANAPYMEMRVAIMTETEMLYEGKSPYKHNRFPFTPVWCYRRARDNMPYGVIRDIRDAQVDYNKRASKALFILSSVRIIMDEGAVADPESVREEAARPDAVFAVRKGYRFDVDQDKSLADQHLKLMTFDGQMIRDVGGVTDQNLGKDDKGLSGQAIGKLQDQGSIVTAALFDNLRMAIQMQSEVQLSLIEQFYSAAKVIRIVGENRPIEWLPINRYDPDTGRFFNDITASKADFIVSEQDFKSSIRQAMFESMMDLIAKLDPQVGMALLDMVLDFADVPNKAELVARVRKINGQADPSRKPTPEEEKGRMEAEAKEARKADIELETLEANLAKVKAEAEKAAAGTKLTLQQAIEVGVKAAYEALQAGQVVATVPNVTPVADAILAGAGYKDNNGQDPNLPAVPVAAQPAQAAPLPELQQTDGIGAGIETIAADGVQPPMMEQ